MADHIRATVGHVWQIAAGYFSMTLHHTLDVT
ncbi:hypothetical protein GGR61_000233 [Xanthomonas arboricola]|nr:hypothetical protein [Xanthomonas sp. 3058]